MNLLKQSKSEYEAILAMARSKKLLTSYVHSAIFINLDILDSRLDHLESVFPEGVLHAIAVKTNPLHGVLKHIANRNFGLETASFGEVLLANKAGIPHEEIVYDAPVKNIDELRYCDQNLPGIRVNANSINELALYKDLNNIKLGLRINTLSKSGASKIFDVSQPLSKFGELIEHREEIIKAFLENRQLIGLHIHIGSQISQLSAHVEAIYEIQKLAEEIEIERKKLNIDVPVEYIDIGGGFPANYGEEPQIGMEGFVKLIQEKCLNLFNKYKVITEFGRFVHAHSAWLYSKINSVISNKYGNIALIHQGANMFVREVYTGKRQQQVFVLDKGGLVKNTKSTNKKYHIGGPLCFAGDYLAKDIELPEIEKDDSLIVSDIGANTFSLYSKHCSIPFPKVIGYSLNSKSIFCIKEKEDIEALINFWN